jgi:acetyltransferase-like isoleucine patch superfamily enzyme
MSNIFFNKRDLKYCGENVIIGKTVRIRKPEECIIHDGTIIDDFAYISCAIEIGRNCHIASHVSISGGSGKFTMGDYSTISNHSSVHCASSDYRAVSADLPSLPVDLQFGGEVEDISIGAFVTVGAHSCILPGVVLPNGFACGAFTLLDRKEYESFALYVGVPSKFLKYRDRNEFNKSKVKTLWQES